VIFAVIAVFHAGDPTARPVKSDGRGLLVAIGNEAFLVLIPETPEGSNGWDCCGLLRHKRESFIRAALFTILQQACGRS
jgi:hypothetical protein